MKTLIEKLKETLAENPWSYLGKKSENDPNDHDCPLVGEHGEDGCDHPIHKEDLKEI